MATKLRLPMVDLSSPDRLSTANSIRQACVDYGFFYLVNHGVDDQLLSSAFQQSAKFFTLPLNYKLSLSRKEYRGYTPLYSENLDPSSQSKELLPDWRPTMESLIWKLLEAGKKLMSLIALSLNLDDDFFEKTALNKPAAFLRLLHYPGELGSYEELCGASAHSDYGMITLLVTDGVPGLQICKEKFKQPRVWEDVSHVEGAFIVNIGDLMERWTNCIYRSTLHRVIPTGKERYSMAFFLDPPSDCVVECFESCCSESSPPRFPPIRSGDY
ncbi:2-oxoglutarate-Fe(II) type oxidoreductase hxnY isoform X2 [Arachis duranensis]|nr:2-oxoglutarate-Fe(II) type oxidoreductase hxnY isoform X2 [Arachis duranensis]